MKKVFYFAIPLLLLSAVSLLLLCKRLTGRTGLACLDDSDL